MLSQLLPTESATCQPFCCTYYESISIDTSKSVSRKNVAPSMDGPSSVCTLYGTLFLCTISVFYCGNLYLFMLLFLCSTLFLLHIFHATPLPCRTFLCSNLFMLQFFRASLFLCIALCTTHDALLHNAMFSFWVLLQLHSLHVAIYFCCTLLMFHYFQGYG